MPSFKPGRKKKPSRLLSSSPKSNDPNQPIVTGQAIPADTTTSSRRPSQTTTPIETGQAIPVAKLTSPSQATTPRSSRHTSRSTPTTSRQLTICQALNTSRVNYPKAYNGPIKDKIKALQTVFPPTFEEFDKKHTLFSEQEDIFKYIKRQDKKTYPGLVETLHRSGLSDEDQYIAIEDTICTVFKFNHCLQYNQSHPPDLQNNERYLYSEELSIALSSIFPGLDLIVEDQETKNPET